MILRIAPDERAEKKPSGRPPMCEMMFRRNCP